MIINWLGINYLNEKAPDSSNEVPDSFLNYVDLLTRWGEGRYDCDFIEQPNDAVDDFFFQLTLKHGPYTNNDALMMKMLHEYNSNIFKGTDRLIPKRMPFKRGKILFILMFSKCEDLAMYMLDSIYTSDDHYYILSISSSVSEEYYNRFKRFSSDKTHNMHVIQRGQSIQGIWSDISLIYMELVSVIAALNNGWNDWSHKIALSETHYPSQPITSLSSYLSKKNQNKVFAESLIQPKDRMLVKQVCLGTICKDVHPLVNFYDDMEDLLINKRTTVRGASAWHVEPRNVLLYLLSCKQCIKLLFMMKHTAVPEEMYFQTLLFKIKKEPYVDLVNGQQVEFDNLKIQNKNLVYIRWKQGSAHPNNITFDDFASIENEPNKYFFARKVTSLDVMKKMNGHFEINKM
ncbi:Oxt [Acrasis kona]|uniref:protein xylosyltransferase n=1 Tax=Acrasis kona TaxID=1008807 RepID=A0AAW2ZE31_9EUKA